MRRRAWRSSSMVRLSAALGHVDDRDSWKTHFADTMRGGQYLNQWRMAELHAKEAPDRVRELEDFSLENCPQVEIPTTSVLHAGLYARTARVPKGTLMTGALIKIRTILIVEGEASIYVGEDAPLYVAEYTVFAAPAGRKQAFYAHSDVCITMIFATSATTVEQAEEEFTDEADRLQTRRMNGRLD